jgi:hypothetical protein
MRQRNDEINDKIKGLKNNNKKDIIIYDDSHEDGNQYINVYNKEEFLFKINRPQMKKLKKQGYKIKRRTNI